MAHGQRVMMKIFKLTQSSADFILQEQPSSQNLYNVYLEDINSDNTFTITPENTPGIIWHSRQSNKVPLQGGAAGLQGTFVQVLDSEGEIHTLSVKSKIDNPLTVASSAPSANIFVSGLPSLNIEFTFYINPQRVNLVANKRLTEVLTRGGYEIQHWGNALTEIQVNGKTGALYKTSTGGYPSSGETIDVTQSMAWKRLSQLRDWYDTDHAVKNQEALVLLGMNYYDRFYTGYFTNFTGPSADAVNPYQLDFAFTFKVQREQPITRG